MTSVASRARACAAMAASKPQAAFEQTLEHAATKVMMDVVRHRRGGNELRCAVAIKVVPAGGQECERGTGKDCATGGSSDRNAR